MFRYISVFTSLVVVLDEDGLDSGLDFDGVRYLNEAVAELGGAGDVGVPITAFTLKENATIRRYMARARIQQRPSN